MKNLKSTFFIASLLMFGIACVPSSDKVSLTSDCSSTEVFNPVTRTCERSEALIQQAPTATLSSVTLTEDVAKTVTLTYSDPNGDPATSCGIVAPSSTDIGYGACACTGGTCNVLLTPDPDLNENREFSYTVTDDDGTSNTQTVTINMTNTVDTPSVANESINVTEDIAQTLQMTAITDGDNTYKDTDTFTHTIVTSPTLGTLSSCSVAIVTPVTTPLTYRLECYYTPNADNSTDDSFVYNVTDSTGLTSSNAIVTIDMQPVNDAPVVAADFVASPDVTEDGGATALNTLSVATDADGDALTYTVVTAPTLGTLSNCLAGTADLDCDYTPNNASYGTDTFTYKANDGTVDSAGVTTVTLNITAVDDAPTFSSYPASTYHTNAGGNEGSKNTTLNTQQFVVAEGASGDNQEAMAQTVSISVSSSNTTILPNENIQIYWDSDGVANGMSYTLLNYTAGTPVALSPESGSRAETGVFYLALTPARNLVTVDNGGSYSPITITVTATDGTNTTNQTFGVDFGNSGNNPPTLTIDTVTSTGAFCKYNLANESADCNTYDSTNGCMNATVDASTAIASPAVEHNIYYEGDTGNCYYSSGGSWTQFFPDCAISSSVELTACAGLGASCIGAGSPSDLGVSAPVSGEYFYYDKTNDQCYRSTSGAWATYSALPDINVNEKDIPQVLNLLLDEGDGTDATGAEIAQEVQIAMSSNNTTLITDANIQFLIEEILAAQNTDLDAGNIDMGDITKDYMFLITPSGGQTGEAIITVTLDDNGTPNLFSKFQFKVTVNPVSAIHGGWTNVQAVGAKIDKYDAVEADAFIKLDWDTFTMIGSSATITGWNIYRRDHSTSYMDYDNPLNGITPISSSTTEYTDTFSGLNGSEPGQVYYYEVRPVDSVYGNSTAVSNDTPHKEIMVVRPPKNMAMVHRWIVNTDVCTRLGSSTDADNNFRCEYAGPGETLDGIKTYYDFGNHLLVDTYEVGCHFLGPENASYASEPCTDADGCIGSGTPAPANGNSGATYYDRATGECYYKEGATWKEVSSITFNPAATNFPRDTMNLPGLPPLTNLNQVTAQRLCENRSVVSVTGNSNPSAWRLPSRKEQVAMSVWDTSATESDSNSKITALETGVSLNASSKCNSSSANGYASYYEDSGYPGSGNLFTIPGTNFSGIRSFSTGSMETASCISKYGLQDMIGNVTEYTHDRLFCVSKYECTGVATTTTNTLCPFSYECSTSSAGGSDACAGTSDPNGTIYSSYNNAVYYDKLNKNCYYNAGAANTTWTLIDPSTASNPFFGCPITQDCDMDGDATFDDSCIGSAASGPDNASYDQLNPTQSFFYDTSAQTCYKSVNATGTWVTFSSYPRTASYLETTDDFDVNDATFDLYYMDGIRGVCNEGTNGHCDADELTTWELDTETNSSGRFFYPMALPGDTNYPSNYSSSSPSNYMLEVGPTSGITGDQLHDDTFKIDTGDIYADDDQCGAITGGGSYLDTSGAGTYHTQVIPCDGSYDSIGQGAVNAAATPDPSREIAVGTPTPRPDVGFRCVVPIP